MVDDSEKRDAHADTLASPGPADGNAATVAQSDALAATQAGPRPSRASMSKLLAFVPDEVIAGRYKIKRMLGHGGMGDVYEAVDLELRTDIALKTVRGKPTGARAERFRREIFLARKVTHPNVCRVFDIGRHTKHGEEVLFITMELLRGQSLADKLQGGVKIPTAEAFPLIKQIASAIGAAHEVGVVHRDLKPGNVMLVSSDDASKPIAKVTDFGVAHAAGDPFEDVSGTGDIVGSPAYMAPEQIEGLEPSPSADVYALGILIYEMITGVRPFHGETSLSSAVKRLKHDAEPPSEYLPDISPIWELAILRCLRREPRDRFQTMADVIEALSGGSTARVPKLDGEELRDSKPQVTMKMKTRKTRIQRRVIALAGVAIAAGLVALVVGPLTKKPAKSAAVVPAGSGASVARATPTEPAPTKAAPTRLVVLPFTDRSPSKDQAFLADGLTDELLVLVGKLPAISVIGRTSAFALKNTTDDAQTIGRKLGVSRLLTGSVARAGDRVRITVQLIDATDGTQLWSDSYDKQAADLFALQDEIATAVARALAVELGPSKPVAGERTTNAEAHTLALRGRALLAGDYTKANLEQAGAAFERAVALDPAYAAAVAGLAVTQYWLRDFAASSTDADRLGKRALELADKARSLGPEVAEAHAVRGFLAFNMTWDWATARAELQRALELEPTNRETLRMYAMLLSLVGETDKAVSMIEQAVASDPLSARLWAHQGSLQTVVGQRDKARESIAKALELNPESSIAHLELATVELLDGHFEKAQAEASRISEPVYAQIVTAMAQHSLGNKRKSDVVLAELIKTNRHTAAYQIAEIYAWRGDLDHAFEWLDNAVGDHDAGLADIRIDTLLTSIRTDPRYRALLTKLGL